MTKTTTYTKFCAAWISIGSSAVVDTNRRISADGHAATMAYLAAQQGCDCNLCHYANKHPQLRARRCWHASPAGVPVVR